MFQFVPLLVLLAPSADDPAAPVDPPGGDAGAGRPIVTAPPAEGLGPRAEADRLRRAQAAIQSARSAYQRGLMPLHDYDVHVRSVRSRLPGVLGARFEQGVYVEVVRRLERLAQPASIGWAADLAEARARLAAARGDDFETQSALTDQAIALRMNDLRIGHASPADVARTLSALAPRGGGEGVVRRRDELTARAREFWTKQWKSGVGRTDELLLARLAGGSVGPGERWELANRAFDAAIRFQRRGTASLFDVTRAYGAAVREFQDLPKAERDSRQGQQNALRRQLATTADSIRDPRGRNRADLALATRLLDEVGRSTNGASKAPAPPSRPTPRPAPAE